MLAKMGLFNKNPNEVLYAGGKKHFTEVIKNTAPENAIMSRAPEEDFNTGSTLVVMPGEKAIFVHNGKIEGILGEGTHVLTTENYPFLSRLRNAFSGGISTYNCVIVFVRTTSTKQIEWGDRIAVRDPVQHIQTDLGIGGSYRVKVSDPGLLLTQLFGTTTDALSGEDLENYFSSEMKAKIKSNIVRAINQSGVEILGIEANLDVFSEALQQIMLPIFAKEGITLYSFAVDRMTIFDNEVRNQLEVNFGKNTAMEYMGQNWVRDKFAEAILAIANNPGSGGLANTAAGFGMGMAAMPMASAMVQQLAGATVSMTEAMQMNAQSHVPGSMENSKTTSYRQKKASDVPIGKMESLLCPSCGNALMPNSKFCNICGAALPNDVFCCSCGAKLPAGSKFCSQCGQQQQ